MNPGSPPLTLAPAASSGLPVTLTSSNPAVATVSGNVVTFVGVGSTTLVASQSGNTDFASATSVSRVLVVGNLASVPGLPWPAPLVVALLLAIAGAFQLTRGRRKG